VTLPAGGRYVVAVWHPGGAVGRYTFVIGEKEEFGGDLAFPFKMRSYWTPVEVPATEPEPEPAPVRSPCGGRETCTNGDWPIIEYRRCKEVLIEESRKATVRDGLGEAR
jgi:hypothetical protein